MPELEGESDVDCSGPVALDSESGAVVLFVVASTSDPHSTSTLTAPTSTIMITPLIRGICEGCNKDIRIGQKLCACYCCTKTCHFLCSSALGPTHTASLQLCVTVCRRV